MVLGLRRRSILPTSRPWVCRHPPIQDVSYRDGISPIPNQYNASTEAYSPDLATNQHRTKYWHSRSFCRPRRARESWNLQRLIAFADYLGEIVDSVIVKFTMEPNQIIGLEVT